MTNRESESVRLFCASEINWENLSAIGIERNDLALDGYLETLLQGEKSGPVHLSLVLPGADVNMEATLQLIPGEDSPVLEITGLNSAGE